MTGLFLALLATLTMFDPAGRAIVGDYDIRPGTIPGNIGYVYRHSEPHTIYFNVEWLRDRISKARGDGTRLQEAYAVGACVLVHEATHLELRNGTHTLPYQRELACLERLGASSWSKQVVRQRLREAIIAESEERND